MLHQHGHYGAACGHYPLQYCTTCDIVYCRKCFREWGRPQYAGWTVGLAGAGGAAIRVGQHKHQ